MGGYYSTPGGGGGGGGGGSVNSVTAGAGLVNSGTAADPVIDVVAADGTITVTANDIAVGTIDTANITDEAVTLAKLQHIAQNIFLARTTVGTGDVETITAAQATAILDLFTSVAQGLVPASGGGTDNFLRADGTWTTPVDPNAIHDNTAGEIAAITEKVSPASGDLILIEDSADSNTKKRVQIGNLPGGGGGIGAGDNVTWTGTHEFQNEFTLTLQGTAPGTPVTGDLWRASTNQTLLWQEPNGVIISQDPTLATVDANAVAFAAWRGSATGTNTVTLTGVGSVFLGQCQTIAGAVTADVTASGNAAVVIGGTLAFSGNSALRATGIGSAVIGYSRCFSGTSEAAIEAEATGSLSLGYAEDGALIECNVSAGGGLAHAYATGASALVRSGGLGALAHGYASGEIVATGWGSAAMGFSTGSSGNGIRATGNGTFAGGYVAAGGARVQSTEFGGFAWGYASSTGFLRARGLGSAAFGSCTGAGGRIDAGTSSSDSGCLAGGSSSTNTIQASGTGNIAWGDASAGNITATGATNCGQFGVGANSTAETFAFGTAIRFWLNPQASDPAGAIDGDIWQLTTGVMRYRSGGANANL